MEDSSRKDPRSRRLRGSKTLTSRAREMRRQASDAEKLLWTHLRGRRMMGRKFRRQVTIEPYIVDFLCLEAKLIVEADGGQHVEQKPYDDRRSSILEAEGYRVLRFWNHEILAELDSVLEQIRMALAEAPSPPSSTEGAGQ